MSKSKSALYSSKLEKFCYAFGGVGANLINGFVSAFLTMYYTDSVGLSAAFAGTMMLVCRIFDGFSDVLMGVIIDKTRSRFGKARAWMLWSTVPLVLTYIAMFNIPSGLSTRGKTIWAVVTYFLLMVVFFTANNLAYHTLLIRFSLDSADRNATTAIRSIFSMIAMMGMNIATPIVLANLGGATEQSAWTKLVLAFGILTAISLFVAFFGTTEKLADTEGTSKKDTVPMGQAVKLILSTKYFYITITLFLVYFIMNGAASGVGLYYTRDVLGNMKLQSVISMVGLIPTFVLAPMMPKLIRKYGKRNVIMAGLIVSAVGCLIIMIMPRLVPAYFAGSLIRSIGSVPMAVALFTLSGDIVDYLDMKHGVRPEGVATAANNIGNKLGSGLGAAILGWMLAFGNYVGGAAVQAESAIRAIIFTAAGIPLIVNIIAIVLFLFWDIEKYGPEVKAYLEKKAAQQ